MGEISLASSAGEKRYLTELGVTNKALQNHLVEIKKVPDKNDQAISEAITKLDLSGYVKRYKKKSKGGLGRTCVKVVIGLIALAGVTVIFGLLASNPVSLFIALTTLTVMSIFQSIGKFRGRFAEKQK